MAIESERRWKFQFAGSTQPSGIVCSEGQAGGPHDEAGLVAMSEASHFLPMLLRYVTPARHCHPPPMLFAHTPEYGPLPMWIDSMRTWFSNVLLTTRAFSTLPTNHARP